MWYRNNINVINSDNSTRRRFVSQSTNVVRTSFVLQLIVATGMRKVNKHYTHNAILIIKCGIVRLCGGSNAVHIACVRYWLSKVRQVLFVLTMWMYHQWQQLQEYQTSACFYHILNMFLCEYTNIQHQLYFMFMPPPFEEWWRGIKCYPCSCVRPFVRACVRPLSTFGVCSITFEGLQRFDSNLVCWYIISKHRSSSI